jgi:hypothetical protein
LESLWEWQRGHDAAVSDSKERRVPQRVQKREAYVSIAASLFLFQSPAILLLLMITDDH